MILVTGGTGFVGSYILYELSKNNSSIKSTFRKEKNIKKTREFFKIMDTSYPKLFNKIIWEKADLTDVYSLDEIYKGIDRIYHCAAFVSFAKRHKNLLMKTNVEGTANIVNLAIKYKIKKLLFISSIASIGVENYDDLVNEDQDWNNKINHTDYALSKYKSELEVWRGTQEGVPAVIVNPGFIIGSHFWSRSSGVLFKQIFKGLKFYPTGKVGAVSVDDVAKASIKLMNSKILNERFILVSKNLYYKELLDLISKVLNKTKPKIPLTKSILYIFYFIDNFLSFLKIKKSFMSIPLISTFLSCQEFDGNKIKKFIDFEYENIEGKIKEIGEGFLIK